MEHHYYATKPNQDITDQSIKANKNHHQPKVLLVVSGYRNVGSSTVLIKPNQSYSGDNPGCLITGSRGGSSTLLVKSNKKEPTTYQLYPIYFWVKERLGFLSSLVNQTKPIQGITQSTRPSQINQTRKNQVLIKGT